AASKSRTCQVSVVLSKHVIRDDGKGKKMSDKQRRSVVFSGQVPKVAPISSEAKVSATLGTKEGKEILLSEKMSFEAENGMKFELYDLTVSDKMPPPDKKPAGEKKDQ